MAAAAAARRFASFPENPRTCRDEVQEMTRCHVAIGGRAFRQIAQMHLRCDGVGLHVMSADRDATGSWRQITCDHFHRGGFAGAIRAEKAEHFAFGDTEIDTGDGGNRSKITGQLFNDDHVFSHFVRARRGGLAARLRE